MKLQIIEEPGLAFHQNKVHVDIRAGLSAFGAFDKGSAGVPVPIRLVHRFRGSNHIHMINQSASS